MSEGEIMKRRGKVFLLVFMLAGLVLPAAAQSGGGELKLPPYKN